MTTFYDRPYIKPEPEPGSEFSSRGAALIAAFEQSGGDIAALKKSYNPLPHWPDSGSGLTIGMGYDLDHQNTRLLKQDWGKVLTPEELALLSDYTPSIDAKGKRVPKKKKPSKAALVATKDVDISYEEAVKVYEDTVLPRYQKMAEEAFPGLQNLDPYSQGAIVSMVYNRGNAYGKKGSLRRKHFMEIREAVFKHDTLAIAATLQDMKAEHTKKKTKKGLHMRRDREAQEILDHQPEIDKFYKTSPMWDPNWYP
jgi:GH24 family phage-related lysozyme (muramidase)